MEVEVAEARTQVERLLRSKTFETSEIHRRLLQYLAEKSLSGEAGRLKEYVVGLEALGKPPSYDPKRDSIARLHVGRLRQKLTTYYETEASEDAVRVSLPKGGFQLKFEPLAEPRRRPPAALDPRRSSALLAGALLLSLIWAAFATRGLVRLQHQTAGVAGQWNPELEAIWSPFLDSDRALLVCLGAPLFLRFPDLGFFRDPKTNDWAETASSARVASVRRALGAGEPVASYSFTGNGEAGAGFLLAKLLAAHKHGGLLLTRSNILSWQQIADNNIIFVGPPKFNPQLQTPALRQDIVIEAEGIRNISPRPGEPVFLRDNLAPDKPAEGETHALISRIPGVSGAGDVLVLGGNASSDTFAAAEWLTDPRRARELVEHIHTATGEIPRYFQVVLKVTFKQGVPVESSYVYHHALAPKP